MSSAVGTFFGLQNAVWPSMAAIRTHKWWQPGQLAQKNGIYELAAWMLIGGHQKV